MSLKASRFGWLFLFNMADIYSEGHETKKAQPSMCFLEYIVFENKWKPVNQTISMEDLWKQHLSISTSITHF